MHLFICGEDHGLEQEIKKEIKVCSLDKKVTILKPLYGLKKYQFLKMLDLSAYHLKMKILEMYI